MESPEWLSPDKRASDLSINVQIADPESFFRFADITWASGKNTARQRI
jgi:hypothetical protein